MCVRTCARGGNIVQYSRAKSLILQRLRRFSASTTDFDAFVPYELQAAQIRLEEEAALPWFLETATTGLNTSASSATVALPTGFLRMVRDAPLLLTNADAEVVQVPIWSYEAAEKAYGATDSAFPAVASIVGDNLQFWPEPDAVYAVNFRYFAKATALADAPENTDEPAWLLHAPEVMINEAGMVLAGSYLNDMNAYAMFESMAAKAKTRLYQRNIWREEAASDPTPVD